MGYIYKITNTINNKVYVGLTTNTIEGRWKAHLKDAKIENPHKILYKAIQKYGADNFIIEKLEEVENQMLDSREIFWIEKLHSFMPNGYNMTLGGEKGGIYDGKEIAEFYLSQKEYLSIQDISNHFGIHRETVSRLLKSQGIETLGNGASSAKKLSMPVLQIDINTGEMIAEFPSAAEAARSLGDFNYASSISKCCRGKLKTAYKYKWQYK